MIIRLNSLNFSIFYLYLFSLSIFYAFSLICKKFNIKIKNKNCFILEEEKYYEEIEWRSNQFFFYFLEIIVRFSIY